MTANEIGAGGRRSEQATDAARESSNVVAPPEPNSINKSIESWWHAYPLVKRCAFANADAFYCQVFRRGCWGLAWSGSYWVFSDDSFSERASEDHVERVLRTWLAHCYVATGRYTYKRASDPTPRQVADIMDALRHRAFDRYVRVGS